MCFDNLGWGSRLRLRAAFVKREYPKSCQPGARGSAADGVLSNKPIEAL